MFRKRLLSASFFFLLVITGTAPAQMTLASLSGSVVDPSGSAVADASVTAQSLESGIKYETISEQAGEYQLLALPVGLYQVSVRKQGFAENLQTGVRLVVGQDAIVNVRLQIGEVSQQIKVVSDAELVSATTRDISGVVGEAQIKDLPLNGRSYDLLLTLNPGVVNYTSEKTGGTGVSNSTTGNNFSVSGNRPQQNLFLLNGVEFTGAAENNMQPGGTSGQLLGVDAVREFNVLRDSYGAEYGKRPGGQVVIATQSGSNQLHGSIYEFLRNNALDASNFFDRGSAPPFQRNQFGASIGGPIKKDKTFFFMNYEGLRQNLHQTSAAFVPDAASRAAAVPSVRPLLNLWPTAPAGAPDFNGIAQVFSSPLQTIREDFGTVRVDQNFSSRDVVSGVYTIDDGGDVTATIANPYSSDIVSLREQVASLQWTHTFSPSLVNVARFGYSRAGYFFTGAPTPGTPAAGVPGFVSGLPVGAVVVGGSAASNPQAQIGLAGSNNGSNLSVARNLYTVEDRASIVRNRQQFSFGVWIQPFQANENIHLSQYGQATFASLQTFLAGTVGTFLYDPTSTPLNWRSFFGAWYAQDVIRVSPNLTVSLGFRAESSTGWNEAHGRAANYTFENGVISSQPRISNSLFATNNAVLLPQPRVAIAWTPISPKTVIRAGFGMYNDLQDALGYRTDQNAPFNPTYSIPALAVSSFPIVPSAPLPKTAKLVPGGVQPDMKTTTLITWSMRVQTELSPNTSLTVGYVGSHGYHEIVGLDANTPIAAICPSATCPDAYPATFQAPLAGASIPAGSFYIPAGTPRANPSLANTWTYFSKGDSSYNALQVDFNRRFSDGLALRGTYTWSKALNDGDSVNATTSGNEPGLVSNPNNIHADRGPAGFDVRNLAVISAVYELPFGRNKEFGHNISGVGSTLISGWSANSIVSLQSGFPFTPQLSYNPSNNGDTRNPVRPFINPDFTGRAILGKVNQWYNPSAFLAPPANSGFFGNLGRNTLVGPGLATWDFSALKNTAISERWTVQFRAEIFNLLDRANFNTPNLITFTPPTATNPTGVSGTAGAISSTSTTARQVQFGVKLLW